MWSPSRRPVGALTALGGALVTIASVPTRWFGPVPTDSYVFDPPRFSALWVERTVIPVVAVVAVLSILLGLLSLFRRDREQMVRWQRWTAAVALVGAGVGTLATVILVTSGPGATGDLSAAFNALIGVAFGLLALVLLFPGLVAWGGGYLRGDRPFLGAALVCGPVLPAIVVAVRVALDVDMGPVGSLPVALPVTAAVVVLGRDLWTRVD